MGTGDMALEEISTERLQNCGICGQHHSPTYCDIIRVTGHIPDKPVTPKAITTVPDSLCLKVLADNSKTICAQKLVERGTRFGPFEAKKVCSLLPQIVFPLKIFSNIEEDLSEYYLDTSNEYECNWMMFVQVATYFEEQNLIAYQDDGNVYYLAQKDIAVGEDLKVWYAPYYARKMNTDLLVSAVDEVESVHAEDVTEELVKSQSKLAHRNIWNCKFCGKIECKLTKFAFHLLDHYRDKRRVCQVCNTTFENAKLYRKHLEAVHRRYPNAQKELPTSQTPPTSQEQQPVFQHTNGDSCLGGPLLLNNISNGSKDNSALMQLKQNSANCENLLEGEQLNLNVDSILHENVKELYHFNFDIDEPKTEKFICDICQKEFSKINYLLKHLHYHTGQFICYTCNKVLASKETLTSHPCESHFRFTCRECGKLFHQQKSLNQHVKVYHKKEHACSNCPKYFNCKKALDVHRCGEKPHRFFCKVCDKSFTLKRNLTSHMKKHTDHSTVFTCPICGVQTCERHTYLRHVRKHEGVKFTCEICNKDYSRKDTLQEHIKAMHWLIKKTRTCEVCGKVVAFKKLARHMDTHRLRKSYICNICGTAFQHLQTLKGHVKKHENDKDEQVPMFCCPRCPRKSKYRSSLRRHVLRSHPDIEYPVKKQPTTSTKIKRDTDLSACKFFCTVCSKRFQYPSSLKRHMVRHHPDPQIREKKTPSQKPEYEYLANLYPNAKLTADPHDTDFAMKTITNTDVVLSGKIENRHVERDNSKCVDIVKQDETRLSVSDFSGTVEHIKKGIHVMKSIILVEGQQNLSKDGKTEN